MCLKGSYRLRLHFGNGGTEMSYITVLAIALLAGATELRACVYHLHLGDPVAITVPSLFAGRHGRVAGILTGPNDVCPTYRVRLNARPGFYPMSVPVIESQLTLEVDRT